MKFEFHEHELNVIGPDRTGWRCDAGTLELPGTDGTCENGLLEYN